MAKKKKKDKPQIEGTSLKEMAKNANEVYGIDWVTNAAEAVELGVTRISTGILEIDLITRGGIPYGQALTLFGADSTGKTVFMMLDAAHSIRTCRHCYTLIIEFTDYATGETQTTCRCGKNKGMGVFVADAEGRWDMVWGQTLGLPKKGDFGHEDFYKAEPTSADSLTDFLRDAIHQHVIDKM